VRVAIIGGGPAGLALALCLKQIDPRHEVTVVDQRDPSDTYGWGITLPRHTLRALTEWDPGIAGHLPAVTEWDTIELIHRRHHVRMAGGPVAGIERIALLRALHQQCAARRVTMQFRQRFAEADPLPSADLVVAADGARSVVRTRFAAAFQPSIVEGTNYYVWLGTPHVFEQLTLGFVESPHGTVAFHAYPFSPAHSTFIVECTEQTWHAARFGDDAAEPGVARLADLFREILDGQPLLYRQTPRWARFMAVRNERCCHANIVLIGDALHAIHFALGSGTMLALQDAFALAESIRDHEHTDDMLSAFAAARTDAVEQYAQFGAERSAWYEHMHEYMDLSPLELAYALLSRRPEEWRRPPRTDGAADPT
jgi:anthraniloyl-CoA monooxygenase